MGFCFIAGCCAKGRARGHRPYRHKNQIIQLLLLELRSKKGGGATRGRGRISVVVLFLSFSGGVGAIL